MPRTRPTRAAAAACLALALAAGACTSTTADGGEPAAEPTSLRLYGTDGTMANDVAAALVDPTVVAGMKGTRPMPELPAGFLNRLREGDPSLQDFRFAGETYDAVVVSALAAELAGTPDPEVVRTYIKGVTAGGEPCGTVADCLDLARDGEDLAYRGVALSDGFTDQGEPAVAIYETAHFGIDGVIDPDRSEFLSAGDVSNVTDGEPPEPRPRTDQPSWEVEPLVFGGMLPETGALALAYPPFIAAAQLAIEDINDHGGVFGVDVEWVDGDTGTAPEVARATLESHVEEGVHILIGPAASGVSEAILPDAVAAERIVFSPSNTAAELVELDHDGFYFRTAPSDTLQGAALADMLLRDGVEDAVIVARDDSYGTGLQANTADALMRFGVSADSVTRMTYPPPAADEDDDGPPQIPRLDRLVSSILQEEPDGLVVIGFDEASQLIQRLVDEGVTLVR